MPEIDISFLKHRELPIERLLRLNFNFWSSGLLRAYQDLTRESVRHLLVNGAQGHAQCLVRIDTRI